jgi:hypothetical protein
VRGGRFLWFLISLALGTVLGLAAGWAAAPLRASGGGLERLEPAYRAEFVLMVAEVYANDGDAAQAARRLAELGDQPASRLVQQTLITAGELGYSTADLDRMVRLVQGLQALPPESGDAP